MYLIYLLHQTPQLSTECSIECMYASMRKASSLLGSVQIFSIFFCINPLHGFSVSHLSVPAAIHSFGFSHPARLLCWQGRGCLPPWRTACYRLLKHRQVNLMLCIIQRHRSTQQMAWSTNRGGSGSLQPKDCSCPCQP
jgi:hypothetical protein